MSALPLPSEPRARRAVQTIFFVAGVALAAWAPMVPYAKERAGLTEGVLGLVLLALGIGGVIAMPLTGAACRRFGVRRTILASVAFVPVGLPLLAWASSGLSLAATLFGFGFAIGMLDVAMNTASVEVERASGKALLSGIHALYSIGSLVGAAATSILLRLGVSLLATATIVMAALLGLAALALPSIPASEGAPGERSAKAARTIPWRVLGLGALCFAAFVTEGGMLDWSAVYLQSTRGVDEASAGFGFVAFAVAMVAARLVGDRLVARWGAVRVVRYGALLAASGFVLAAVVPTTLAAGIGYTLVGLGAGNIVPSLFGAAGRAPELPPAHALAIVSGLGYAGSVSGPAAIGAIAAATSLGTAFLGIAASLLLVALGARLSRRPVERNA